MANFLEEEKKLSESILWQLQKTAYEDFGLSVWTHKRLPFYLTSTPMIAHQYANVVLGFIRDLKNQGLDLTQPLYIFDLGAGTGRFSYLFLKHLLEILQQLFDENINIQYVMTDMVEENIEFWQKHSLLKPYIEKGVLDFAFYYHSQNAPLKLIRSGKEIGKGSLDHPVILLANYFFDSLPQDLFMVNQGQLFEGRITTKIKGEQDIDLAQKNDPKWIMQLEPTYTYHLIDQPANYYGAQTDLSKLLIEYSQHIEEGMFLFPLDAFKVFKYFNELCTREFLLVCADQGVASKEQVKAYSQPKISLHDTFSFPVDYYAFSFYFRQKAGKAWLTSLPDAQFVVMSAIGGKLLGQYRETQWAFRNAIDAFEPVDYWNMLTGMPEMNPPLSIENIIALLKLGQWDPVNLHHFWNAIQQQVSQASKSTKEKLARVIHRAWEEYFPVGLQEQVFIRKLALLLLMLDKPLEAGVFFERANKLGAIISVY